MTGRPDTGRDDVNHWIRYHGEISRAMTLERTALESALIPVTPYILIACVECYRRYPDMIRRITAATPPESLGAAGRVPGVQVDAVHLWSLANFPLVGRQVLSAFGMVDAVEDVDVLTTVFGCWQAAAQAFRADGHLQAWDAGFVVPRYPPAVIASLLDAAEPVADDVTRARVARANAVLTSFLFLLYFDTRAGYQDTGPYELPDGRVMLVRDFCRFGVSHFPWSAEVCAALPVSDLTVGLVLRDVRLTTNDWGTSITEPSDYFQRVEGIALCVPDGRGGLAPLGLGALDELAHEAKQAQRALYRLIAGMTRAERIDAGAYVYFTFLRAFAEVAGVAPDLDWTCPRDSTDVYALLSGLETTPEVTADPDTPYYAPVPIP